MHAPPMVSVIVPVHNGLRHIHQAAERLKRLRGRLDVILLDDGSTDGSHEVLRALVAEQGWCFDATDRSRGVAHVRRRGIELARGEWVWFVDIDDIWDDAIVDALVSAAVRMDVDAVCCRARRREADGRSWVMEGTEHETVLEGDGISRAVLSGDIRGYLWNKLFRRSALESAPREHLSSQDDFLTVLDALAHCRRVGLIADVLYEYIEQPGSISVQNMSQLDNTARCAEEVLGRWLPARRYRPSSREREYFRLWFQLVPSLTTPVHRRWPRAIARQTRRELGPRIRMAGILEAVSRGRFALAAHACAIRIAGPTFPALYRFARWTVRPVHTARGDKA